MCKIHVIFKFPGVGIFVVHNYRTFRGFYDICFKIYVWGFFIIFYFLVFKKVYVIFCSPFDVCEMLNICSYFLILNRGYVDSYVGDG